MTDGQPTPADNCPIRPTPGPWRVVVGESVRDGVLYAARIVAGDGPDAATLADLRDPVDWTRDVDSDPGEALANARLMAAARALLAIAKTVAGWPHRPGEHRLVDAARDALARLHNNEDS